MHVANDSGGRGGGDTACSFAPPKVRLFPTRDTETLEPSPRRTMNTRRIRKIVKSRATTEGAGVHLHRAIGFGPPDEYDPFLLLDDFRSEEPSEYRAGFPWHPHRGV